MKYLVKKDNNLSDPVDLMYENIDVNGGDIAYVTTFIPLDRAPDVLAVNSDFDEGRIDSTTGYAIPDCDDSDIALEAARDHLDGKYPMHHRITEDMHPGFFGVRPADVDDSFWDGATVTIKKIDKIDAATGYQESGHVRFYGKWGNAAGEYRAIIPYDFTTLTPVNLAAGGVNRQANESVYGTNSPFSAGTAFFMEGVHPGKITLEWRYVKGNINIAYQQTFEVCTNQTAYQWKKDMAYKIRLETSNDPSGQIDVRNVPTPGESYRIRMERASEYYDFYQDCFLTPMRSQPLHPQAMTWPGLARLAGSQVVGGLSDSEYARLFLELPAAPNTLLPEIIEENFVTWSLSETKALQQALFTGAKDIFKSIGWQMHAYRSSGYRALAWVAQNDMLDAEALAMVTDDVWKDLRMGILNHNKTLLDRSAFNITDREQNVTIAPTWGVISSLGAGIVDFFFTILGKNSCTPSGIDFTDVFPIHFTPLPVRTGNLSNAANRWLWIHPSTANGILDTWNKQPEAIRAGLAGRTLDYDARRFSLLSHYPTITNPITLPVWVWDYEDVK